MCKDNFLAVKGGCDVVEESYVKTEYQKHKPQCKQPIPREKGQGSKHPAKSGGNCTQLPYLIEKRSAVF